MGSLRTESAHKLRTWFTNFHKSTEQQTVPLNCSHLLAIGGSSHSYLVPHLVSACHLNTNCCVVLSNILVSLFAVFLRYCKLSSEPFWLTFSSESQPTVAKCQQHNYPRWDSTPPLPLSVSFFPCGKWQVFRKSTAGARALASLRELPGLPNIEWMWYFPRIPSSPNFQCKLSQGIDISWQNIIFIGLLTLLFNMTKAKPCPGISEHLPLKCMSCPWGLIPRWVVRFSMCI